ARPAPSRPRRAPGGALPDRGDGRGRRSDDTARADARRRPPL
ncbi:MAG: hypothetical protein AVDCRST_MAG29-1754, partial [uncultured Nocardioidaceae bacterium]